MKEKVLQSNNREIMIYSGSADNKLFFLKTPIFIITILFCSLILSLMTVFIFILCNEIASLESEQKTKSSTPIYTTNKNRKLIETQILLQRDDDSLTCEEKLNITLSEIEQTKEELEKEKEISKKCTSIIRGKYNVSDPSTPVQIFFNKYTSLSTSDYQVEIDGSIASFENPSIHQYKFSTAGIHEVIISLSKPLITLSCFFYSCAQLIEVDFSSFKSNQVESMTMLFFEANLLKSVNFTNFVSSHVTDMSYTFHECFNLETINGIRELDTSKVISMGGMFRSTKKLKDLDLSKFVTSNVETMESMFLEMESITSLDLSTFDTSKVKDMRYMFYGMKGLKELNIAGFSFEDKVDVRYIFKNLSDSSDIKIIFNSEKQKIIIDLIPPNWTKEDKSGSK